MNLVSQGSVGSLCVALSASSRSAWYAVFTLVWWIQEVTPETLTAVGVVRTTVYGSFQCGAKESCFQSLTHTWSLGTNSWICSPRGTSSLSCTNLVTWFITWPNCFICCEIPSATGVADLPTPVLLWEGASQRQFHMENNRGIQGYPYKAAESKSIHEQSVSMIHFESVSLRVRLVLSTTPELWGLYAIRYFHLIFRALHTCWINSVTKGKAIVWSYTGWEPKSGDYLRSREQATSFASSVRVGKASSHPEKVHTMTSK